MEVGAIKQAFNNEVILLKKKLNQAKIQIIHKLTRKAKQLLEKKAPEPLKEKLKRKAQAAVNEVLIIKKIKPKDIAKFIVTHKRELKDFLNKPTIDNDKVCARLLLHKALQDKYNFIRGRFSNVPIQDLFMSRLERRKMKKEAKEKQDAKKKGKNSKVVNSEGDWNVEDVIGKSKISEGDNDGNDISDEDNDDPELGVGDSDDHALSDDNSEIREERDTKPLQSEEEDNNTEEETKQFSSDETENESDQDIKNDDQEQSNSSKSEDESSQVTEEISSPKKIVPGVKKLEKCPEQQLTVKKANNVKPKEVIKKNPERKQKDINKNKNFSEKIQKKKLKKDTEAVEANKIVDPFFVTATGENYMSVVEPRGPDEVKAEHKQGNRKLRRAAMFGHVPNIKPRYNNNSYINDNRFSKNSYEKGNKSNDWQEVNNRKPFNNKLDDRKRFNDIGSEKKEEKLHPSWEAKKKKSGILPFEGKKIVFD